MLRETAKTPDNGELLLTYISARRIIGGSPRPLDNFISNGVKMVCFWSGYDDRVEKELGKEVVR